MKLLKRVQELAAFTKNEQKVFLFLSVVLLAGVSIKAYKAYFVNEPVPQFDYSVSDKEFEERSRHLTSVTPEKGTDNTAAQSQGQKTRKKINLNTATKNDLVSLPGIGEGLAEEILLYRDERGSFTSVDELRKIKGIGAKKFEKLRPYIESK